MQIYLSIGNDGRILIPKAMREALEIKCGGKVIATIVDNSLNLTSVENALDKARNLVKNHCKTSPAVIDDFIMSRRKEAKQELEEFASKTSGRKHWIRNL